MIGTMAFLTVVDLFATQAILLSMRGSRLLTRPSALRAAPAS